MMQSWYDMSETQLRRMIEESYPAINKAGAIYGPVPTAEDWAKIDMGKRAQNELNRRAAIARTQAD